MSSATSSSDASASPPNGPRKLKILMLHGYTQSGPLFHAKTRALEKALHKAFPPYNPTTTSSTTTTSKPRPPPPGSLPAYPGGISLIYPSGPRKLRPSDIPGFTPSTNPNPDGEDDDAPDCRAWWQRNDNTGEYAGLDEGLQTIADTIRAAGGVDGVIGFSQGAAAAAIVASLLEPGRRDAFATPETQKSSSQSSLSYPSSFLTPSSSSTTSSQQFHAPLKFAVSYSGFLAPHALYTPFYHPQLTTAMLHFIGSLDSVVEESRCLALAAACEEPRVVFHPGGHFVPIAKEWVGVLVGFVRERCGGVDGEGGIGEGGGREEVGVEGMDVPF